MDKLKLSGLKLVEYDNSYKEIFIPYNVPSLKNSKVKTSRGIFASKTVKKYLTALGIQKYSSSKKEVVGYAKRPNLFKEIVEKQFKELIEGRDTPYLIGFHFVRDSKRDFDFNNATQIIQDLLVAHNVIEDDCCRIMIPLPYMKNGKFYTIDKSNPGVYITIINY